MSVIFFIPLMSLLFIKNMNLLLKIAEFGAYPSLIYLIFVVVRFVIAAARSRIIISNIEWFTLNIGNLAGSAGMACAVQTNIIPFTKGNKDQSKNVRDVGISYLLGFLLYEAVGIIGALAVSGEVCE